MRSVFPGAWLAGLAILGLGLLPAAASGAAPNSPWRGRIGVEVQPMTPELRRHLGAPEDRGVLVARVSSERPAARAGVEVGDVLTMAGEAAIETPGDLVRAVAEVPEGEELELRLVRDGKRRTLRVKPEGEPWALELPQGELGEWMREGLRLGREELRRRLEDLERRLEELERKLETTNPPGRPT